MHPVRSAGTARSSRREICGAFCRAGRRSDPRPHTAAGRCRPDAARKSRIMQTEARSICPRRRSTPARMSAAMPSTAMASVHGLAGSALKFCANVTPSDCRAASTGVMPNTHTRNAPTVTFSSSMMRRKNCKLCAIPFPPTASRPCRSRLHCPSLPARPEP